MHGKECVSHQVELSVLRRADLNTRLMLPLSKVDQVPKAVVRAGWLRRILSRIKKLCRCTPETLIRLKKGVSCAFFVKMWCMASEHVNCCNVFKGLLDIMTSGSLDASCADLSTVELKRFG